MKTPVWQLPYPALTDPADITGVDGVDDLALRLETILSQLRAAGAIPGEVKLWSGSALPAQATYGHWVWADGAAYLSATYPLAAAAVAPGWRTFDGVADPGAGNFRVPDLRGVTPAGLDQMPGGARANRTTRAVAIVLAGRGGEEYHTITLAEAPAHAHTLTDPGHGHTPSDPTHAHLIAHNNAASSGGPGVAMAGANNLSNDAGTVIGAATGITIPTGGKTGITEASVGGGGAHENVPPTVYVPYIVKLDD